MSLSAPGFADTLLGEGLLIFGSAWLAATILLLILAVLDVFAADRVRRRLAPSGHLVSGEHGMQHRPRRSRHRGRHIRCGLGCGRP